MMSPLNAGLCGLKMGGKKKANILQTKIFRQSMSKIATQECKSFLANFFKQSPNLIKGIWGDTTGDFALSLAIEAKNWKRISKTKFRSGIFYLLWSYARAG